MLHLSVFAILFHIAFSRRFPHSMIFNIVMIISLDFAYENFFCNTFRLDISYVQELINF